MPPPYRDEFSAPIELALGITGVAYPLGRSEPVMAAVDRGLQVYSAVPLFMSYSYKARGRRRATGDVAAHKSGGGWKPKLTA